MNWWVRLSDWKEILLPYKYMRRHVRELEMNTHTQYAGGNITLHKRAWNISLSFGISSTLFHIESCTCVCVCVCVQCILS